MKRTLTVEVSEVESGFYHPREITIRLTPERAAVLQGACVARGWKTGTRGYILLVEAVLDEMAGVEVAQ